MEVCGAYGSVHPSHLRSLIIVFELSSIYNFSFDLAMKVCKCNALSWLLMDTLVHARPVFVPNVGRVSREVGSSAFVPHLADAPQIPRRTTATPSLGYAHSPRSIIPFHCRSLALLLLHLITFIITFFFFFFFVFFLVSVLLRLKVSISLQQ